MKKIIWILMTALLIMAGMAAAAGENLPGAPAAHEHVEGPMRNNEDQHWIVCGTCGEVLSNDLHWARCDRPDTCAVCGMTAAEGAVIARVVHDLEGAAYLFDSSSHWMQCRVCGEGVFKEAHFAACENPDACEVCGRNKSDGIQISAVVHGDPESYFHDAMIHWYICPRCGKAARQEEHCMRCTEPGVCMTCGAAAAEGAKIRSISHGAVGPGYEQNGAEHWMKCRECGQAIEKEFHWAFCIAPDQCAVCGTRTQDGAVISDIRHKMDGYRHDDSFHWAECKDCGEQVDKDRHWADCAQPGQCAECGAKAADGAVMSRLMHDWDSDGEYDQRFHWQVCSVCGEEINRNPHFDTCTKPGVCILCGAQAAGYGAVMQYTSHDNTEWNYVYDDKEHWTVCSSCGEKIDREAHYTFCNQPGVCALCGFENADIPVEHVDDGEYIVDGDGHAEVCALCGEKFNWGRHLLLCGDPAGRCSCCFAPYDGEATHELFGGTLKAVDEKQHESTCLRCGRLVREDHAFREDGTCLCGYKKQKTLPGDVNGDGNVDGKDVLRLARYLSGANVTVSLDGADMNGDGKIDGRDLLRLAKRMVQ